MERTHARGFTLLETVVSVAIAVVLGWVLLTVITHVLLVSRVQAARDAAQSAIMQLTDNLTTEEDDAWAIYVPPSDVLGASNGDGHEVDFFARDGKQQPYFWAYNYDSSAHALTRYRFASPGGSATKDVTYSGVTAFSAQTYPITALQDSSTPVYSPMYGGARLQSGIVHFYPGMPWIAGGNNITYIHVEASGFRRDLQLATSTAPSGFTVVLNYTPSPAPTAAGGPVSWPPAIVFAAPGTTIAAGASKCNAVAYNADGSGNPTTAIPAGTVDPYNGAYSVGADGCWNGEDYVVTENGYTGSFADDNSVSSCSSGGYLFPGSWSPSTAEGPTALQTFTSSQSAVSTCSVIFRDNNSRMATSYAAVRFPSPMYVEVDSTVTRWSYDCNVQGPGGRCLQWIWSATLDRGSAEYSSVDQGATWQATTICLSYGACSYPATFTDTQTTCTSDQPKNATGKCTAADNTDSWSPYRPPNAP